MAALDLSSILKYLIGEAGALGVLSAVLIMANIAQWLRGQADRAKVEKAVEALTLSTAAVKEANEGRSAHLDIMNDILRLHHESLAKIEGIRAYIIDGMVRR